MKWSTEHRGAIEQYFFSAVNFDLRLTVVACHDLVCHANCQEIVLAVFEQTLKS